MIYKDRDILAEAAGSFEKKRPNALVGSPEAPTDNELWRCGRCGGTIRNNADIRHGKRCQKCGSPLVVPGHPSFWETVYLYLHTWNWKKLSGTIYLMEPKGDTNESRW